MSVIRAHLHTVINCCWSNLCIFSHLINFFFHHCVHILLYPSISLYCQTLISRKMVILHEKPMTEKRIVSQEIKSLLIFWNSFVESFKENTFSHPNICLLLAIFILYMCASIEPSKASSQKLADKIFRITIFTYINL